MKYTILFAGLAICVFIAVSWTSVNTIYQTGSEITDRPIESTVDIVSEIGGMPGDIPDYWVWKSDGDITTLITYQFMHGSIFHIVGNMIMLFIFGIVVESRIQSRIIPLMLFAGIVGGVAHTAFSTYNPIEDMVQDYIMENIPILGFVMQGLDSAGPAGLVGMSGAISGLVGAYLAYFPGVMNGFRILGVWLVGMNIIPMIFLPGSISYEAHIGGFIAGIIMAIILKKIESSMARQIGPGPNDGQPLRFPTTFRQPIR